MFRDMTALGLQLIIALLIHQGWVPRQWAGRVAVGKDIWVSWIQRDINDTGVQSIPSKATRTLG